MPNIHGRLPVSVVPAVGHIQAHGLRTQPRTETGLLAIHKAVFLSAQGHPRDRLGCLVLRCAGMKGILEAEGQSFIN